MVWPVRSGRKKNKIRGIRLSSKRLHHARPIIHAICETQPTRYVINWRDCGITINARTMSRVPIRFFQFFLSFFFPSFFLFFAITSRTRFHRRCIFVLNAPPGCIYLFYPFACSCCFALIQNLSGIIVFSACRTEYHFWEVNGIFCIAVNDVFLYCYIRCFLNDMFGSFEVEVNWLISFI